MVAAVKAKKAKVEKVVRVRKQLEGDALYEAEAELVAKYKPVKGKEYLIVSGSLWNSKDPRAVEMGFGSKRTVEILCQFEGCNKTRRVATSDLAQVRYCEEHTQALRLIRRREARKVKAEAKKKEVKKAKRAEKVAAKAS
jgi:hypothetical protein